MGRLNNTISSFPKIFAIGDKRIDKIFLGDVEITEKVDGSQFGFGKIDGELMCRSKGKQLVLDAPEKMFAKAVEEVLSFQDKLIDGNFYYAEYLNKPKHNTIKYERVPEGYLALFGMMGDGVFVDDYERLLTEAAWFGIEAVPLIYRGIISDPQELLTMLNKDSLLGGSKIEGVVIKNYAHEFFIAGRLYPIMCGKYVSEKFKEVHGSQWKKTHTGKGKWEVFVESFRTEARWEKAVQHLGDGGQLEGSPRDIGALIKETQRDIIEEEQDNIKQYLWNNFGAGLLRKSTSGLPEWYKEKLLKNSISNIDKY